MTLSKEEPATIPCAVCGTETDRVSHCLPCDYLVSHRCAPCGAWLKRGDTCPHTPTLTQEAKGWAQNVNLDYMVYHYLCSVKDLCRLRKYKRISPNYNNWKGEHRYRRYLEMLRDVRIVRLGLHLHGINPHGPRPPKPPKPGQQSLF